MAVVEREEFVTNADGVSLYCRVRGSGADPWVVVHGGPGLSSAYLAPDLDGLAEQRALVCYDQRGGGRSTVVTEAARLRIADHLADLEAVRRHFALESAVVLGHSWGAVLAAFYARAYPDRVSKVILLDPMPLRRTPYMSQFGQNLRAWMDPATRARVEELDTARHAASDPEAACRAFWRVFIRGYLADPTDPSILRRMKGDVCDAPPEALRNRARVWEAALGPEADWDWREAFREVRVPVLIVHGVGDPIPLAAAREWQAALPEAELVAIENAGHFPHVEQPAAFLHAVESFANSR